MNKSWLWLATRGLCIVAFILPGWAPAAVSPAAAQTNLLFNPGFEEGFQLQGAPEVSVGTGWTAWWVQGGQAETAEGYLVRPEYKGEDSALFGSRRVHGGRYSQKFFNTFSTHDAGLFQVVTVPAGATLRLSAWVQTWSSSEDNPDQIVAPGNYFVSVGIDPTGATNPAGGSVVWSAPALAQNGWVELSVTARAQAAQVTVFLRGAPQFRVKHNDSYWDDVSLVPVSAVPPAPAPTPVAPPVEPSEGEIHVVRAGDTLLNIALRYGTTIQVLMELNGLQNANFIWVGQRMLVRGSVGQTEPAPSPGIGRYTVQRGDTLASIARRFGTTVAHLAALNSIVNPERIYVGQSLILPGEGGQSTADSTYHVVQPGETLSSIAARYGVSLWAIAEANHLVNVNLIRVGTRLVIPAG